MMTSHNNAFPTRNRKMTNSSIFFNSPSLKTNNRLSQFNRFKFSDNRAAENHPKEMLSRRTIISQSDILTPFAEHKQLSSGFSKLDSMARHIPATYEDEFYSQNHQNHPQSPLSKDSSRVTGVNPFPSKINAQENMYKMDKKDNQKRINTDIFEPARQWKQTADQITITRHDAIVADNLHFLQRDKHLASVKPLRSVHEDCESTNSGSGNQFKPRNFDFLKKRKQRQQQGSLAGSASLKQFQPFQSLKKSDIIWPLSMSPIEQKVSFMQKQVYKQVPACIAKQQENLKEADKNMEFKKKPTFLSEILKSKEESALKGKNAKLMRDFTIGDFQILDKLGKGSLGDVYVALEKSLGFICVIKKMSKKHIQEAKVQQHIIREIKIQSYLNHNQLTSIYGYFHDEDHLYLILELLPDGSLQQVKKKRKLPEKQTVQIIKQVAQGLKYMHEEYIIHRDLKPQNLFANQGYIKIGDFGCSIYNNDTVLRNTVVGSLEYFAPEQLSKQGYSQKIDSWSLGILTFELLYGKSPFVNDIKKIILSNEAKPELSEVVFPQAPVISQQGKQFITKLLKTDPDNRMDMDEVLAHSFLRIQQKRQKQNF